MAARDIIKTLGPKAIADRVGVHIHAVYNCKETMPPSWYPHVRDLCAEAGIECPDEAFRWAPGPKSDGPAAKDAAA